MLTKILIIVAVIVVLLVVVVATRPSTFRVSRAATLAAPTPVVFAQVNDLHNWEAWSPWAKLDPNAKTSYEGPAAGTGAVFHWAGNSNVGEGTMTIVESRPSELVRFKIDFVKPFAGTNDAEFTFQPEGNGTVITWTMSGRNNFIAKAVGLVIDCDKMVGGMFEQGLASLKSIVETPSS